LLNLLTNFFGNLVENYVFALEGSFVLCLSVYIVDIKFINCS